MKVQLSELTMNLINKTRRLNCHWHLLKEYFCTR